MARKSTNERAPLSGFGLAVRVELLKRGKTQSWLVQQVREETGMYFDNGWLQAIISDRRPSLEKKKAICRVFGWSEEDALSESAEATE